MKTDWQEVIERAPRGPFRFYTAEHNTNYVVCGTVARVEIRVEFVNIHVKWAARCPVNERGIPNEKWEILNREPVVLIAFANDMAPYVIEPTPKGDRVRLDQLDEGVWGMLLWFIEDDAAAELAFTTLEAETSTLH